MILIQIYFPRSQDLAPNLSGVFPPLHEPDHIVVDLDNASLGALFTVSGFVFAFDEGKHTATSIPSAEQRTDEENTLLTSTLLFHQSPIAGRKRSHS